MPTSTIPPIGKPLSRREMRVVGPALIALGLILITLGVMTL